MGLLKSIVWRTVGNACKCWRISGGCSVWVLAHVVMDVHGAICSWFHAANVGVFPQSKKHDGAAAPGPYLARVFWYVWLILVRKQAFQTAPSSFFPFIPARSLTGCDNLAGTAWTILNHEFTIYWFLQIISQFQFPVGWSKGTYQTTQLLSWNKRVPAGFPWTHSTKTMASLRIQMQGAC